MEILMNSTKKQQSLKGKPRGRPFPPGVSGNPRGRPRGALNKLTMAVLAGNRPLTLDKSRHYEAWSDCFVQAGMRFRKDNFERVNPKGPVPIRPEQLDIREIRQEVVWKGRRCWSQFGWLFDPGTRLPITMRPID
jgi:hypothetical protein